MNDKVVICIPTKRPPPVLSFQAYPIPHGMTAVVIAGPDVYAEHSQYYSGPNQPRVVPGVYGMGAQSAECYIVAAQLGFPYFFRMDDDLVPGTFVAVDFCPDLLPVITQAYNCMIETGTTHAGFSNTSRLDWLGTGYKRTFGLIHGGANIAISCENPDPEFISAKLVRGEDVYRTAAHRTHDRLHGNDGSVGRVAFIGFNKRGSTRTSKIGSSISATQEQLNESRDLILSRFGHIVSCNGTRWIHNDTVEIPNWRFNRFPKGWTNEQS